MHSFNLWVLSTLRKSKPKQRPDHKLGFSMLFTTVRKTHKFSDFLFFRFFFSCYKMVKKLCQVSSQKRQLQLCSSQMNEMPFLYESVKPALVNGLHLSHIVKKKKEEKTPQLCSHLIYTWHKQKSWFKKVFLKIFKWASPPSQCPVLNILDMQIIMDDRSHGATCNHFLHFQSDLIGSE